MGGEGGLHKPQKRDVGLSLAFGLLATVGDIPDTVAAVGDTDTALRSRSCAHAVLCFARSEKLTLKALL
jgi:hypothetical protein